MSFHRLRRVSRLVACVAAVGVASLLWTPVQADPSFGMPDASSMSPSSDRSTSPQSSPDSDSSSLSQSDSATASVAPVKDPLALRDRGQTYDLNPVTVTTTTQYLTDASAAWSGGVSGDGSHCAQVERLELAGMVDQTIQHSVSDKVTAIQDDYLKALWDTDHLVTLSTCARGSDSDEWASAPGLVRLGADVTANFSNVISVAQTWSQPGLMSGGSLPGVNVRLDTGADIDFRQVFGSNADVAKMIREQALASYPRMIDTAALSGWLDAFAADADQPFSFSGTTVSVSLPDDGASPDRPTPTGSPSVQTSPSPSASSQQSGASWAPMDRRDIVIPFDEYWSQVTIFNLAAQASGLYVEAADQPTCPVLTDYRVDYPTHDQPWSGAYCWAGSSQVFDEVDVEAAGG
ncbi:MAG: hypothetical protein LBV00_06605, partial [Propionibacteriaceae bacterium]|nr:hypothetical protein [Propionibacteriaceae bacterium]